MSKYKGFCIAIIGTNGTGKSTFMKKIFDSYKRNVLLIMDDDSEEMFDYMTEIQISDIPYFKGVAVCYSPANKKEKDVMFDTVYNGFGRLSNGGLMALDDAMTVLDTRNESVMQIFKKRRQRKMDIILNCHGASEYPVSLFKNTTHFVVCRTVDSYENITARMNKETAKTFIECINFVNKETEKNPYFKVVFPLNNPQRENWEIIN